MDRYVCIHGHFYQPPRENPWLETIEVQDSAYPYHDWNERIDAECYSPNAFSRILDGESRIERIANNYSRISFNFGPTLLSWLEARSPDTYEAILRADRLSMRHFSGHGSAIAQPYNHMIMPLASPRDRETQILWGLRDFQHRFRRDPEGVWLPETAVDLPTLEILAAQGIRYTILEPGQARRIRKVGAKEWKDASGGRIDPTRPYEQRLPSGRRITIFFYDGPVSRAVAFERLLDSGERFAGRLTGLFSEDRDWPQMVNIATDGETYGHHHRYGDMALAYALQHLEEKKLARLTNYAEYLEKYPPTWEVEIHENTAWSCAHGVGRWSRDCGCATGGHAGWNQAWRGPLRDALNWLRDTLEPKFETLGSDYFTDPWKARNDYISVVLDRTPENVDAFLVQHRKRPFDAEDRLRALRLMELQRHAMLMYTSCGWFFDELSGIETVQILQYAGRVVQLAGQLFGDRVEEAFLERLAKAKSNIAGQDGRTIYERYVKTATVDLAKVGAHYAMSSLFQEYEEGARIYCFRTDRKHHQRLQAGRSSLAVGRTRITSEITGSTADLTYGVVHFGDHNLMGGVRPYQGEESFQSMVRDVSEAFNRADLADTVRRLDRHFGTHPYSLASLFRDEQRKILQVIMGSTMEDVVDMYRRVYEPNVPLLRFLSNLNAPAPKALKTAAEVVLNHDLGHAFREEGFDPGDVAALLAEGRAWGLQLDTAGLEFAFEQSIERLARRLKAQPTDHRLVARLTEEVEIADGLPLDVNLTRAQNIYWELLQTVWPEYRSRARSRDGEATVWIEAFRRLGDSLRVRTE